MTQARDRTILARADALAGLVENRLPQDHVVHGDADAWPMVGTALLSRCTTTLRSVMQLMPTGQALDAATLNRSLYDHLVHLAWLAADPSEERMSQWRRADLRQRLKADNDGTRLGQPLLDSATRAEYERQAGDAHPLHLSNLAEAADKAWAQNLPGMEEADGGPHSFRHLYVFLFRNYSATAHASFMGLNHVIEDVSATEKRVVIEKDYEGLGPYGLATVLYGRGLLVTARWLGWPDEAAVHVIFDRFPG